MRPLAAAFLILALACSPALAASDPKRPQQWGLDMVEADQAHARATGTGAIVAVIDSGVQADHPDLAGRLLPGYDFVDDDATPQDGNGHGTHVSGIVAATTGNGIGVASVAPGAMILPVRVLDDEGAGTAEDVKAGIDWAVAHGADVINLSLGEDVPFRSLVGVTDEVDDSIRAAIAKGVVVVVAAGNSAFPVCGTPGGKGMLCVGAVNRDGTRSAYSNFGSGVSLSAPGGSVMPVEGEGILSTYKDSGYAEVAGTSQAAPHVAGVAALLVSLGVKGQAAADAILRTATDAGQPGADAEYGAGIVNAARAVASVPAGQQPQGASGARVVVPRTQRIRTVLRRGLAVRCTVPQRGRCSARVSRRGRTLAGGSRVLEAGTTGTVRARVNGYGRRALRRARRMTVRVTVRLPGSGPQVRTVVVRR